MSTSEKIIVGLIIAIVAVPIVVMVVGLVRETFRSKP